ncbi:dipeptidase [candidate division KSB1 bacterium]|nr:dipeptidase [candidate division KSB1 bacterium]
MQTNIPICDLHCDTATGFLAGIHLDDPSLQVNLPAMQEAGIGLQVFACYIPPSIPKGQCFPLVNTLLDHLEAEINRYQDDITICRNFAEIEAARQQDRIAAIMAVENGNAIDADLGNLQRLYDRGVRLMTIIHAKSNEWAISSNDKYPAFAGLSPFGEEVVKAMNELGMIIDVSHAHDITVEKVLQISGQPIVASHSCAHTICPADRNLKDELLVAIAEHEGMVGLNLYPGFLDGHYYRLSFDRAGDLFEELSKMERSAGLDLVKIGHLFTEFSARFVSAMDGHTLPLERFFDHILYISDLIGAEFIGFGSDFDGVPTLPEGVRDCLVFKTIRDGLFERNYSKEEVEAICWNNFMRIIHKVCK